MVRFDEDGIAAAALMLFRPVAQHDAIPLYVEDHTAPHPAHFPAQCVDPLAREKKEREGCDQV